MTDELDDLIDVLNTVHDIVAAGREAFDADRHRRWALERAWIFAGNLAEHLSRRFGHTDLWSELIGVRNVYAHYTPGAIDYDRVWFDASTEIERVLAAVHEDRTRRRT